MPAVRCWPWQLMTGEPRPRYSAPQLLGGSGACGLDFVMVEAPPFSSVVYHNKHIGVLFWRQANSFDTLLAKNMEYLESATEIPIFHSFEMAWHQPHTSINATRIVLLTPKHAICIVRN